MRGNPLNVLYYVGFGPWWGRYDPRILDCDSSPMLGGGETAALRTALGLASIGHSVTFCGHCVSCECGGVSFRDRTEFAKIALTEDWDAVVSWSDVSSLKLVTDAGLHKRTPRTRRLMAQQLNDLAFEGSWWDWVDGIVSPSQTHADYLTAHWMPLGVQIPFHVVHNGVNVDAYGSPMASRERPPWVAYWSSPDRGLHHVLRAWPLVEREVPSATLHIFYEIDRWVAVARAHAAATLFVANYVSELRQRSLAEGWRVEWHGACGRRELMKYQSQTVALAYPCDPVGFTEGFSNAIAEALAAGTVPILRPVDALPELYGDIAVWLEKKRSDGLAHELAKAIVYQLQERPADVGVLQDFARNYTWDAAATQMERAIRASRRNV